MYYAHYGLDQPPFRITPDPALFFPGGNRGAVLEALLYAIKSGEGIVKVVGEVGSGKTMLCRMLERELPDGCEIIYLANPSLAPAEVLHAVAFELKLPVSSDTPRLQVMHLLQQYLLEKHGDGRQVIVFIEEAQGMPEDTLEELRLLSNLETSREKLLQLVLFGQPELDDKLNQHRIRQLKERITFSFALTPLTRAEVREYLNARLYASGYRGGELFSGAAVAAIHRYSRGLLRRVNILADKALLAAFAEHARSVGGGHVRRAAADSDYVHSGRWITWALVATVVLLTAVGLMVFKRNNQEVIPMESASPTVGAAPAPGASLAPDALEPGAAQSPETNRQAPVEAGNNSNIINN